MTAPALTPAELDEIEHLARAAIVPSGGVEDLVTHDVKDPTEDPIELCPRVVLSLLAMARGKAEAEAERDAANDFTWFWQIVDHNGLANVPSEEPAALKLLVGWAAETASLREQVATLSELMKMALACEDCDSALWTDRAKRVLAATTETREDGR